METGDQTNGDLTYLDNKCDILCQGLNLVETGNQTDGDLTYLNN